MSRMSPVNIIAISRSSCHRIYRTSRKKERLQEYVRVSQVPDITDEEEREIDQEGSKAHHRVWVSSYLVQSRITD